MASTSKSMQVLMKLFGYNDGSIDVHTRLRSFSSSPKTALQESWSDEGTMEMVERANACKNGRYARIECDFLSRLEDEEGTRGKKELCRVSLFFRSYNIVFYFVKCYFAFT